MKLLDIVCQLCRLFFAISITAFFCFSFAARTSQAASQPKSFDLSIRSGVAAGKVAIEKESKTQTHKIGGIPLVLGMHRDLAPSTSFLVQVGVFFDVPNQQLMRQGFDVGGSYHFLGGARRLTTAGSKFSFTTSSSQALSLALRAGMHQYTASDRRKNNSKLSGRVFEVKSGLEYRREFGRSGAIVAEVLTTVLTIPASVDHLSPQTTEVLVGWRSFF